MYLALSFKTFWKPMQNSRRRRQRRVDDRSHLQCHDAGFRYGKSQPLECTDIEPCRGGGCFDDRTQKTEGSGWSHACFVGHHILATQVSPIQIFNIVFVDSDFITQHQPKVFVLVSRHNSAWLLREVPTRSKNMSSNFISILRLFSSVVYFAVKDNYFSPRVSSEVDSKLIQSWLKVD